MFSIVMPLWNKRHTIAVTVASALAQTYRDFELIVVDDGSTDGGIDRLAAFSDTRIRKLVQPRAGPGAARNTGIEAARHDWIAFLDADDIWLPDHLAELDRIRVQFPQAGLIGTSFISSDRNGGYRLPARAEERIEAIDYLERVGGGEWPICTSSSAIPKSSYIALGGFGGAPAAEDAEYWARIALERPAAASRRVTTIYRLGTGGISDTARSLWFGRELRQARDLGPSVALLLQRYPGIRSAEMRGTIDRYIDRRFQDCVRRSARLGDFRTLRSLPGLYLRPPPAADRLILAIARMPPPVARAVYGLGFKAKALLRLLRPGSRTPGKNRGADPRRGWRAPWRLRAQVPVDRERVSGG
jgi:glycosyltransferase involved in cell wall biosynthesis